MYYEIAPIEWSADVASDRWFIDLPIAAGTAGLDITAEWHRAAPDSETFLTCEPLAAVVMARVGPTSIFQVNLPQPAPTALRVRAWAPPNLFVWRTGQQSAQAHRRRSALCRALDSPPRAKQRAVGVGAAIARLHGGDIDACLGEFGFACLSQQTDDARAIALAVLAYIEHHPLVRSPKLGEMVGALAGLARTP